MPVTEEEVAELLGDEPVAAEPTAQPITEQDVAGLFEEHEQEQDEKVRLIFENAQGDEPERRADILRLAEQTRVRANEVEQNYDKIKASWDASQFDPRKWRAENPVEAKLLLEQPELGQLAIKDKKLSFISQLERGLLEVGEALTPMMQSMALEGEPAGLTEEGTARLKELRTPQKELVQDDKVAQGLTGTDQLARPFIAYSLATKHMEHSKLGFEVMVRKKAGLDTWELEKKLVDLKPYLVKRDLGQGPIGQIFVDAADTAASQVEVLKGAGALGAGGAIAGGIAGGLITRSAAGVRQGAVKGLSFGGKAGAVLTSFELESGSAYLQMREARTDDGTRVDDETAMGGAIVYGILAAGIEFASLGPALSKYGPLGDVIRKGSAEAFAKAMLADPTLKSIAKSAGKRWLKAGATEGAEETLQAIAEDAVGYLTRTVAQGEAQQGPMFDPETAFLAGEKAFVGSMVTGAGGPALNVTTQLLHRDQSAKAGERVQRIIKGAGQSPTVRAAPEAVARLIEEETKKSGDAVTHMYVDAEAFQRLFQENGADPAGPAAELLGEGGYQKVLEAVATGDKLEIPVAEYLEKWASKPIAEALAQETTTRPGYLTPRQLAEQEQQVEKLAQEIAKESETEAPTSEVERSMIDQVEAQMTEAGPLKAKEVRAALAPMRAFMRTMAERAGQTVDEMFGNVKLEAAGPKAETAVSPAPIAPAELDETFSEFPPASVTLASRFKDMPAPELAKARADEFYRDPISGLRNRRAFDALPTPEGMKVAVITSTDVKGINDHPTAGGHDVANGLLRAMGRALFDVAPEAARSGTNFLLYVKDDKALETAVKRIRQAVGPNVTLEAGIGQDKESAFDALTKTITKGRASGRLAAKGQVGKGLDVAALSFPEDVASATVPDELAAPLGQMGDQEYFETVYTNEGLLTAEGWRGIPRKANTAAFDLRGLGNANDVFGKPVGDRLIAEFRSAMVEAGGSDFDAAHLSGDEFAAQSDDKAALERYVRVLTDRAKRGGFTVEDPEVGEPIHVGVAFRHGIGSDYGKADRELNAKRRAEEAEEAVRESRGFAEAAEREALQAPRDDQGRRDDLGREEGAAGEPAQGRARPQAYPRRQEEVTPQISSKLLQEAHAAINRMRPDNKAMATAWLEYVFGEREKRPFITPKMERKLAEYGIVDPAGYPYDDHGRSLERTSKAKKKFNDEPAELRRYRLEKRMGVREWLAAGYKTFYQSELPTPVAQALSEHEARIKGETNEHAVVLDRVGNVVLSHTSDHPARVEFTLEQVNQMADGLFTHNHPRGRTLSVDDLYLAMFANVREIRAVSPDGSTWRVVRPDRGWGFFRDELREVVEDLRRADAAANLAAVWRMDRIVEEAGGDRADGRNAKGYTDKTWNELTGEESTKAFNVLAEARGWGWKVERLAPREDLGGQASGERRSSGVPEEANGQLRLFQGPRGYTEIVRKGTELAAKIVLGEKADVSTVLHESAHIFLEMLRDIAGSEDSPARIKEDWATTLKWLGVEKAEDIQVEHHEKFARAMERYFYEGKAPSSALVRVFTRLRLWLKTVYRTALSLGEVPEEVRDVFDRMFATDAELERTRRTMGLKSLFRSPEDAGMSTEEWQAYLEVQERAHSHAADAARARVLKDKLRETETWWKAEEKELYREALTEHDAMPASRALRYLKKGELEGVKNGLMGRLDKEAVATIMGGRRVEVFRGERKVTLEIPEALAKLLRGRIVKEGGEHPDGVAEMFGYATGRDMLEDVLALPEKETWARETAAQRMQERHPDVLSERDQMRELTAKGLHGDFTQDWLLREWKALRSKAGQQNAPPVEAIKRAAALMVERRQVRTLDATKALSAERSAADKAARAAAKGDFAQAYVFKQQQLLNHYLYRELAEAREERESFEGLIANLSDRKRLGSMGLGGTVFRDVTETILEAIGELEPDATEAERQTVDELLRRFEADMLAPGFDVQQLKGLISEPVGWKDLTVAEMRNLSNALKQIKKVASDANKVRIEDRRVTIQEVAAKIMEEASARPDKGPLPKSNTAAPPSFWLKQWWYGVTSSMLDPEEMLRRLGPTAYKFFWQRYIDQRNLEHKLAGEALKSFADRWADLPDEMQRRRYEFVDTSALPIPSDVNLGGRADRQWMWMVAANFGTESNRERLLGGYGWTDVQVLDFLNKNMTKEEWLFVQGIWDLLDKELYPLVSEAYESVNGIAPRKIQPASIETPHGTMRGGYFPARYSPAVSRLGRKQDESAIQKLYSDGSMPASVAKSFTKERAKKFTDVIDLNWTVMPSHVSEVIHYVAFDGFVRDAARVLFNETTEMAIQRHLGVPHQQQIEAWLKVVASAQANAGARELGSIYKALGWMKNRFVIGVLGWSLKTALGDLTNPLVAASAGSIGWGHMTRSYLRAASIVGWGEQRREALERSPELRLRADSLRQRLNRELAEIGPAGKRRTVLDNVRETAWVFMEMTDRLTSTVIWEAAYRDARASGLADAEAIRQSDARVRGSMPTHELAEQPALLRDKRTIGALIAFFTYFSKLYNINARVWDPILTKLEGGEYGEAARSAPAAAGKTLAVLFFAGVVGEYLSGRGPEEDEESEEWLLRKMLAAPALQVPFIGAAGEYGADRAVAALYGRDWKRRAFSARAFPAMATMQQMLTALERAANSERDGDKRVLAGLEIVLLGAGLPASQPARTLGYLMSAADGEAAPRDPLDFAAGAIYGRRENQPSNPLSDASDAVFGE